MRKTIYQLTTFFALLSALVVLTMMSVTTLDIIARWTTGRSIPGAQELSESFMVAIVYLGMSYALYRREHVVVAVLTSRIAIRPAVVLRLIGQTIMIALVIWMIWVTAHEALRSFVNGEVRFGLLQMQIWPARLAIPLGLTAFLLQAILDFTDQVIFFKTGHLPVAAPETQKNLN